MTSPYQTDLITIVHRTYDINGVPINSETKNISARIEDYNGMLRDQDGNEVVGNMLIILDPDVNILYTDFIKIEKKNGIAYELDNKEFAIKKIENAAGFSASHKEVYI
jgi:hypothetical protein